MKRVENRDHAVQEWGQGKEQVVWSVAIEGPPLPSSGLREGRFHLIKGLSGSRFAGLRCSESQNIPAIVDIMLDNCLCLQTSWLRLRETQVQIHLCSRRAPQ